MGDKPTGKPTGRPKKTLEWQLERLLQDAIGYYSGVVKGKVKHPSGVRVNACKSIIWMFLNKDKLKKGLGVEGGKDIEEILKEGEGLS